MDYYILYNVLFFTRIPFLGLLKSHKLKMVHIFVKIRSVKETFSMKAEN